MHGTLDATKQEAFGQRMVGLMNEAALALMISVGHRTALFDTMAALGPATSADLARAARLNERYVREWLGAMATGRMVTYDPASERFTLPPEHAAWLTRAASPTNLAATAQFIALLGQVEDPIVECFRNGGGVPYEAYPRFHEVMAEESAQTVVSALTEHILPLDPRIPAALSRGIDVLDVGCGRGMALLRMARAYPRSRFTGYDLSEEAVQGARSEAQRLGLANIVFERRDAAQMEDERRFDLITAFDAIHDQAEPAAVLERIARALRPDGIFLMQDISGTGRLESDLDHPHGPLLYAISCLHCMTVSLARDGAGLGAMWGRSTALAMLREAGFDQVDVKNLPHDTMNDWYLARRSAAR